MMKLFQIIKDASIFIWVALGVILLGKTYQLGRENKENEEKDEIIESVKRGKEIDKTNFSVGDIHNQLHKRAKR